MDTERWKRVESLFLECLALGDDARRRRLDEAYGGDEELRKDIESMLRADDLQRDELRDAVGKAARAAAARNGLSGGTAGLATTRSTPVKSRSSCPPRRRWTGS